MKKGNALYSPEIMCKIVDSDIVIDGSTHPILAIILSSIKNMPPRYLESSPHNSSKSFLVHFLL